MNTLSTGQPATLGSYLDNCKALGMHKAAEYIEGKIVESSKGRDEEVLADESQMVMLLAKVEFGK